MKKVRFGLIANKIIEEKRTINKERIRSNNTLTFLYARYYPLMEVLIEKKLTNFIGK